MSLGLDGERTRKAVTHHLVGGESLEKEMFGLKSVHVEKRKRAAANFNTRCFLRLHHYILIMTLDHDIKLNL